jgi:hypothetical protein
MAGSAYPAFRRGFALLMAGYQKQKLPSTTPARRAEAAKLLDAALHLLPVSAAEDERSPKLDDVWFELARAWSPNTGSWAPAPSRRWPR